MNAEAEKEIARLCAAMDGPASHEPTIRAAMEFVRQQCAEIAWANVDEPFGVRRVLSAIERLK